MNNSRFGKTIEIIWKNRDINLVTTGRRRNYLVSEPNKPFVGYRNEKNSIDFSILHVNKTVSILVWLRKTKIRKKNGQIMLYWYRELYSLHKNGWHL